MDVCVHVCGPCSSLWCDRDPRVDSSKGGCAPFKSQLRFWVFPCLHKDLSVRLSGRVHSGGCEVISPAAWLCISPMTNAAGLLLPLVLSYSTSLGNGCSNLLSFFSCIICLFAIEFHQLFTYFGNQLFIRHMIYRPYFPLSSALSLPLTDGIF